MASSPEPPLPNWFLRQHPNLDASGFAYTSPPDERYNCVAWALGLVDGWFEPGGMAGTIWPTNAPSDLSVAAYTALFQHFGYELCPGGGLEDGYEKVAIYGDDGGFCHVARQSGYLWSSKLGELHDIEHSSLGALEDRHYGSVVWFLRRVR